MGEIEDGPVARRKIGLQPLGEEFVRNRRILGDLDRKSVV